MSCSKKRCWAEVDLEALARNVTTIRARLGAKCGIMAVVKANAYGHGVVQVARALERGLEAFGVANVAEAVELAAIIQPHRIFILGTALPEEYEEIALRGFVPVISSFEEAMAFERLARHGCVPVNVAIDTGMGRIGVGSKDAIAEFCEISLLPRIDIKTISTHLPVADEDDAFTKNQLERFSAIVARLREAGIRPPLVHVLNSAGAIHFPEHAHDLARVGLALYGSSPIAAFQKELHPVMTLKTRVTIVRDLPAGQSVSYGRTFIAPSPMRVATLAAGYADGYQRRLSNQQADVLVRGVRCPVLGRVTMDQIMVDVSNLPDVEVGEEVVLMGRQGEQEILAAELAQKAGTIAWEIFTGISHRVERIYLHQQ
jgi:alanine racemase